MVSSSIIPTIANISQQYATYASLILFIIGIIGHSLHILVLCKLKIFRNNPCVFYFIFESIVDISQLIFYFATRLLYVISGTDLGKTSPVWCKLRTIIGQALLLISLCTACFTAFDQFLSTSYFFYLNQMSTVKMARCLTMIAVCFSFCHAIPQGYFFEARLSACSVYDSILIGYYSYFFYPFLTGLFPIMITTIFSILAYRHVRQIIRRRITVVRRRLDRQLTAMTLTRIVCFNILYASYFVYLIYSINIIIQPTDSMRLAIEQLIRVIMASVYNLNYALNFYIFWILSSQYRRQVKYVLVKKCWKHWKQLFLICQNQVNPLAPTAVSSGIELE